ncbi:unnamed protein product, partial [Mesorhabditis belari]|uniref:DUF8206 domain-containing protein n=1 Tax=Mesorhabditis belari TaxID=2138241 RepID=A0AAF3FST1_9BILA
MEKENIFCVDNEGFRFICARFSGPTFSGLDFNKFTLSWKHSSNEVRRLLAHAASASPYDTSSTKSLNQTRTWTNQLLVSLYPMSTMILENCAQLEVEKARLTDNAYSIDELRNLDAPKVTSLEIVALKKAQVVCKSRKCVRYEVVGGKVEVIHKVCHKECNSKPNAGLERCLIFRQTNPGPGICELCLCPMKKHKRVDFEQKIVTRVTQSQQISMMPFTEMRKRLMHKRERLASEYSKELNYILFALATFSLFLDENQISKQTNPVKHQLQKLLDAEERHLSRVKNGDPKKVTQLRHLFQMYCENWEKLVDQNGKKVTIEELAIVRNKLFSMAHTGAKIAEIFEINVDTDHQESEAAVTRCEPRFYE